jgi:hypothetical protein
MAKFKVPSWLQTSHTGTSTSSEAEKEKKRQNRRSFSGFSHQARAKPEIAAINKKPDVILEDTKAEVSQLVALAKKITAEAEKLEAYLKDNDLPQPGFGIDTPADFPSLPPSIQKSRQEIVYATRELGSLVRGPRESLRWGVWSVCAP